MNRNDRNKLFCLYQKGLGVAALTIFFCGSILLPAYVWEKHSVWGLALALVSLFFVWVPLAVIIHNWDKYEWLPPEDRKLDNENEQGR